MDVDGDGTIDVDELASAIFGRPPPALDKSYISIMIEQIDLDTEMLQAMVPNCQLVRASIDFMSQHRGGLIDQSIMVQQGCHSLPISLASVVLNHEQVCVCARVYVCVCACVRVCARVGVYVQCM